MVWAAMALVLAQDLESPAANRLAKKRLAVARGGGGRDTEDAVLNALRWLARHQEKDGSWAPGDLECGRVHKFPGQCTSEYRPDLSDREKAGEPLTPGESKGLRELAAELGADEYARREKAQQSLLEAGPRALPLLDELAHTTKDLEIRARLNALVQKLSAATSDIDRVAVTAPALLAFSSSGYTPLSRDTYDGICFGTTVNEGVGWLINRQRDDGFIGAAGSKRALCGHALATLAILDLQHVLGDSNLLPIEKAAVRHLSEAELPDDPLTVAVAGWALLAAKLRGLIDAPKLKASPDAAVAGIASLLEGRKDLDLDAILKRAPSRIESPLATWMLGQTLFQADGPAGDKWREWNARIKSRMAEQASTKDCLHGSCKSAGANGARLGRAGTTACFALWFTTYYRYPVFK